MKVNLDLSDIEIEAGCSRNRVSLSLISVNLLDKSRQYVRVLNECASYPVFSKQSCVLLNFICP